MWSPHEDKFHISIIRSPAKPAGGAMIRILLSLIKNKLVTARNKPDHSYSIQEIIPCSTSSC